MEALVARRRIRTRRLALTAACGLAASALAAQAAGASSGKVPRCETVTVKGARWGVYIAEGNTACATAATVLTGVLAGKGESIDKGPLATYVRFSNWVCPYFQMGVLTCEYGTKPVANPTREVFGLSCSTEPGEPACPARGEP